MKRASRKLRNQAAGAAVAIGTAVAPLSQGIHSGGGSGFAGADFSTKRGYVYFPTLETRREVDSYTHLELLRRARWLKRNVGFARRCCNGIANMVGFLSPRALTADREWNQLAEKLWEQRAGSAYSFDKSARFNVYGYQPLLTRSRLTDGDILSVLTESDNGSGGAMVMTYESHQISNGLAPTEWGSEGGWRNGVLLNPLTRQLAFRVRTDPNTNDAVDIPSQNAILHADYDSFGWSRGVTAFHHAINHLLDATEIISDTKLGIKTANRIGYWEYTHPDKVAQVPGATDAVKKGLKKGTAPGGGSILLEDTFRGGRIPGMEPGHELKTLLDERPHPNSVAFLEYLNRDIAAGLGMSSDVLWNIAKLGGASVRYVLADAQTFIESQQQLLVDQFLTRFWIYFCAKEMKAGRLRACTDPSWWAVGFIPPAKLTVDIGRDGKLSIDLHRAGMLTMKRWYGMQGLDDEAEDKQRVEEYARRLVLCQDIEKEYRERGYDITIDPEKVFPTGIPGAPQQGTILGPDGQPANSDPSFNAAEHFTYIEGRLDEIAARFGAAA